MIYKNTIKHTLSEHYILFVDYSRSPSEYTLNISNIDADTTRQEFDASDYIILNTINISNHVIFTPEFNKKLEALNHETHAIERQEISAAIDDCLDPIKVFIFVLEELIKTPNTDKKRIYKLQKAVSLLKYLSQRILVRKMDGLIKCLVIHDDEVMI